MSPAARRPLIILLVLLAAVWVCAVVLLAGRMLDPVPPHTPEAAAPQPAPPPQPPAPEPVTVLFAPGDPRHPGGVAAAFRALVDDARVSVACAFYDLELQAAADALIACHRRGVRVGIVSDSDHKERAAVNACVAAGIPVVFDNRGPFMHNKFCVVDGRFVWTGSTNMTENCTLRNNNHVLIFDAPKLAANFTAEFGEMFADRLFGPDSPRNTPHPAAKAGDTEVECYFAPEDNVEREVVRLIAGARERVDFMAFSFTSPVIAKAMAERISRGVPVRGLFEKRGASGKDSQFDELAALGAQVKKDGNPANMHHKAVIVDNQSVAAGSYNFSRNANERNDENLVIIHDPKVAGSFTWELNRLFGAAN